MSAYIEFIVTHLRARGVRALVSIPIAVLMFVAGPLIISWYVPDFGEALVFLAGATVSHIGRGAPRGPGTPGLVSVIIPTYNRARLLRHAIESALAQTYQSIEVIVVDDGSTDDSADVAARYGPPARVRYLRQQNGGVASARNRGLREANGEFIAFLDSDDIWHPWKVAAQIALLRRRPDVGMVWTDMTAVDSEGRVRAPRYLRTMYTAYRDVDIEQACGSTSRLGALWADAPAELADHLVHIGEIYPHMFLGSLVHTSTVLLRRERAQQLGGFDEDMRHGEDYDYHYRTTGLGPVALIDACSILYVVGEADQLSAPSSDLMYARQTLRTVLDALADRPERITLTPEQITARLARVHAWLGEEELSAGHRRVARGHLWSSLRHRPWQARPAALLLFTFLPPGALSGARAFRQAFAAPVPEPGVRSELIRGGLAPQREL